MLGFVSYFDGFITSPPNILQEVSQSSTPHWRRENTRNNLKLLKKSLDNLDKQKKASVMNDVVEEAKRMISENPDAVCVVKELKAFSNAKVTLHDAKSEQ